MLRSRLLGLVGAVLLTGPTFASDSKAPDLSGLREAVAAADKRGENVNAVREALTAFEKALTKGAIKPGEAPPELVALREAVEMAARKGERVEEIAKELGAIEKALTGREYERPKPPEPKPEPKTEPTVPFRPRPGFGRGNGIVVGPVNGFNARSVTIVNGNFTIKARQGDVTFEITGQLNGTEAPKIVITDGDKKVETDDLKKVPEDYRPAAERLLQSIRRP